MKFEKDKSAKKAKLADVCNMIAGFAFKSGDFGNYKDKVIKITNITPPVVDMRNLTGVDLSKYDTEKLKTYYASEGDYVFAMTGAIGKIGRIEKGGAYINQRVLLFRNKENVDKDFLYYALQQYEFNAYVLNHIDSESVQPNISAKTVGKYEIVLPAMGIQKRIGSILRRIDEKCEFNRRINNNLQTQAIAMVEEYCANTREQVALSKLMRFDNGFAFQSTAYQPNGDYRVVTIKNVQDGFIDTSNAAYLQVLPTKMKSCCKLKIGDVLLSLTGNVGRVGIVYEENLLLNQRVAKAVPNDNKLQAFLYFVLRQPSMKSRLETIAKGTAQQNLSTVETVKLSIPFDIDTVKSIADILDGIYNQLICNFIENARLSALRDTLLPKLMSGEIDVSDIEI